MADQATGLLSSWLRYKRQSIIKPYLYGDILDYGCGVGKLASFCKNSNYWGIDRDQESIKIAQKEYPEFNFMLRVPDDKTFDAIILLAVIEHISNPIELLIELGKKLNTNGSLILTTPHPSFEWIHSLGAKIGLFSPEAEDEHEILFDKNSLGKKLENTSLQIQKYQRFLFGANQLFILKTK